MKSIAVCLRLVGGWRRASLLALAFMPCVSTWAEVSNSDTQQDTVRYSGADSGSTSFHDVGCLGHGGKLILLTAGSKTEIGPKFALSFSRSGDSIIEFVPEGKNEMTGNFVASAPNGTGFPGLEVTHHQGIWLVSFRHLQLRNPRAGAGKSALELNGSISCKQKY